MASLSASRYGSYGTPPAGASAAGVWAGGKPAAREADDVMSRSDKHLPLTGADSPPDTTDGAPPNCGWPRHEGMADPVVEGGPDINVGGAPPSGVLNGAPGSLPRSGRPADTPGAIGASVQ